MFDIVPFRCVNPDVHSFFLEPALSIPSHPPAALSAGTLTGGMPRQDESTRPVLRLV